MTRCYSITTLHSIGTVHLLDGDTNFPYVEKDGKYSYYAIQPDKSYALIMESEKNLGEKREE